MDTKQIILVILSLYILYVLYNSRYELFFTQNTPAFMSKDDTIKYFKQDIDGYVKNLTDLDLIALKSTSHDDYINKIITDAADFSQSDKKKLIRACGEADDFFRKYKGISEVNFKKLANMNWIISKTNGKWYEAGYPHTRENIIFITQDVINHRDIVRIMIHEKIHVFERLYPEDIENWMKSQGYKPYKLLSDYPLARSNPDVNGIVYLDKNGNETLAQFKNKNPSGIDDAVYPGNKDWKFEHPYETLAYLVDYAYAGETFN